MTGTGRPSDKLVKNTVATSLGTAGRLVVGLLLVPFMVSHLGPERYGFFSVVFALVNYFALLDLGVATAFVKHIAHYQATGERDRLDRVLSTGLAFSLLFGAAALAAGYAAREYALGVLSYPETITDARFVYMGLVTVFVIRNSFAVYRSSIIALQRLDLLNAYELASSVVYALGVVLALSAGYGLRGLVVVSVAVALARVAVEVYIARGLLPGARVRLSLADRASFRELFGYGSRLQAARVAELVSSQIDKVLLGHYAGMGPVTLYDIGYKAANTAAAVPSLVLPAIAPAASELTAKGDAARVRELYLRGTRYAATVAAPMTALVLAEADRAVSLWMGGAGYGGGAYALRVLAFGQFMFVLASVGRMVARGVGDTSHEMRSSTIAALVNIGLSWYLVVRIGFSGVLFGTAAASMAGSTLFVALFHKAQGYGFRELFGRAYMAPVLASLPAGALAFLLDGLFPEGRGRLSDLGALAVAGAGFMAVCVPLMVRLGALGREERELAAGVFSMLRGLRR